MVFSGRPLKTTKDHQKALTDNLPKSFLFPVYQAKAQAKIHYHYIHF